MPRVVIVGGGIIGCAAAYYLAGAGASVTLLERGAFAGEASGAAAGMLAALSDEGGDRGPDFQQLCLESLALYEDLLPELGKTGIDVRHSRGGVLHLALSQREAVSLQQRFQAQRENAPENLWLEGSDVFGEEPQASPAATAALLSPREHSLDARQLTLAFAAAARSAGAVLEEGIAVRGFLRTKGKVTGVLANGQRYEADAVLLAGGPWTAALAAKLGANVPVRPVRGQMISLRGPAEPLRRVVWGERAYLVPREEGQTYVGATVEEAGFRRRNTAAGVARLRRSAAELVPALAKAELVRAWSGLRPATPDGLPILGPLPGLANVWVATGHFRNGILLAPITGKLVTEGLTSGRVPAQLRPFLPSRFTD